MRIRSILPVLIVGATGLIGSVAAVVPASSASAATRYVTTTKPGSGFIDTNPNKCIIDWVAGGKYSTVYWRYYYPGCPVNLG